MIRRDLGNQAVATATRKSKKLREKQEEADYRFIMATPQGRRIMGAILVETGAGRAESPSADARYDAFIAGKRFVGHTLADRIRTHCIDMLRLMEDEARLEAQLTEAVEEKASSDEEKSDE